MRSNTTALAGLGFVVSLAIVGLGYLVLRGNGPRHDAEPIISVKPTPPLKKPTKPALPQVERPRAAPVVPAPAPAPAVEVPTDVAAAVDAILKEYDDLVAATSAAPNDASRIQSLRDRQEKLEKLIAKLVALGPTAVPYMVDVLHRDSTRAEEIGRQTLVVRALARIPGKEAVEGLGAVLAGTSAFALKMTIVAQLAENNSPETAEILAQRVNLEKDPMVRARILNYLGQQKNPQALLMIGQIAGNDENPNVRIAAIRALGDANDPSTAAILENIARNTDTDIGCRQNAIQIYARVAKDNAVPMLEQLLQGDTNIRIKAVVILALEEVGGDRARQDLERTAVDTTQGEDVQARARGALAAMDRQARAQANGIEAVSIDRKIEGLRPIGAGGMKPLAPLAPRTPDAPR